MIRTEFGIVSLPLRVPCSRRRNGCQSTPVDVFFAEQMHKKKENCTYSRIFRGAEAQYVPNSALCRCRCVCHTLDVVMGVKARPWTYFSPSECTKISQMVPRHMERRHNTYRIWHCTAAAACGILSASSKHARGRIFCETSAQK